MSIVSALLLTAPFPQRTYQRFDISELFNLLAYLVETDKQGKTLPGRVRGYEILLRIYYVSTMA